MCSENRYLNQSTQPLPMVGTLIECLKDVRFLGGRNHRKGDKIQVTDRTESYYIELHRSEKFDEYYKVLGRLHK